MTGLSLVTLVLATLVTSEAYYRSPVYVQPYSYVFLPSNGGLGIPLVYHSPPHNHVSYTTPTSTTTAKTTSSEEEYEEEDPQEITQFHSEDEEGRIVYGFHGPQQARMEARDIDGHVSGTYSYLDPQLGVVKMHYWDDGTGYHAQGNSIPVQSYSGPSYTPEVQAARDKHFKLFNEILMSTTHAANPNKFADRYPYVENPLGGGSPTDYNEADIVTPSYNYNPYIHQTYLKGQVDDERDSISLDNPEFQSSSRQAKNMHQPAMPETRGLESSQDAKMTPKKSFYYHFQHSLNPKEMKTDNVPLSKSSFVSSVAGSDLKSHQKVPNLRSFDPPLTNPFLRSAFEASAVHDTQISPAQTSYTTNFQSFPETLPEPFFKMVLPVSAVHDSQLLPNQRKHVSGY